MTNHGKKRSLMGPRSVFKKRAPEAPVFAAYRSLQNAAHTKDKKILAAAMEKARDIPAEESVAAFKFYTAALDVVGKLNGYISDDGMTRARPLLDKADPLWVETLQFLLNHGGGAVKQDPQTVIDTCVIAAVKRVAPHSATEEKFVNLWSRAQFELGVNSQAAKQNEEWAYHMGRGMAARADVKTTGHLSELDGSLLLAQMAAPPASKLSVQERLELKCFSRSQAKL